MSSENSNNFDSESSSASASESSSASAIASASSSASASATASSSNTLENQDVNEINSKSNDNSNSNDSNDNSNSNNDDSVDIEYNIDYILDIDEKLINIENIKSQVDKYIDNYNSDIMKEYKIKFNKLYQKYSNKKYHINIIPIKDKFNSTKIIVTKNDKTKAIITEITKPIYIYYDLNSNLYKLKNNISNKRAELLYKYEILVSQLNVSQEDKLNFEKERGEFIKLLEEYYIYTLYHKKINKISFSNKTKLIIQSKYIFERNDETIPVLTGDDYYINNNTILSINNYNIDKLTKYNNIILQLSGKTKEEIKKDTKLIEEIKLYLDKKDKTVLIKSLEDNKNIQDNYINYIVSKLPIIHT